MGRPGLAEYYDKSGDMDENGVAEEKGLLDLSAGKNILLLQQGLRDYGFHDIASQLENLSVSPPPLLFHKNFMQRIFVCLASFNIVYTHLERGDVHYDIRLFVLASS